MAKYPKTIENRWDILYKDYPEVYDEFASVPKNPPWISFFKRFNLNGKVVADIGSGSGLSSFELAGIASRVIGIEQEESMLRLAEKICKGKRIHNVEFRLGDAKKIPLEDNSVDAIVGITLAIHPVEGYRNFVKEAMRVVKKSGQIIMYNISPGWYGGELHEVVGNDSSGELDKMLVEEFGFDFFDVFQDQEYGSLDKILRTYGFIFGQKAIDYLTKNNKTSIRWKFRIHHKTTYIVLDMIA